MSESAVPPVTFGVKVTRDDGPGGHVHFDLFAGRNQYARGRSGSLVLRHEEFEAFVRQLRPSTMAFPPPREEPGTEVADRVAFDPDVVARWADGALRQLGEALRPSVQAWGELAAQYAAAEARRKARE